MQKNERKKERKKERKELRKKERKKERKRERKGKVKVCGGAKGIAINISKQKRVRIHCLIFYCNCG